MLKDSILGFPQDTCDSTLLGVVNQVGRRQEEWHQDPHMYEEQAKMFGKQIATERTHDSPSRVCEGLIDLIRNSIRSLDL